MAQSTKDGQLQDKMAQLNVILTRRNEFLRELFRMMKIREGVNAVPAGDDDEEMEDFLKKFDLEKSVDQGSISNLTDAEISFPIHESTLMHVQSAHSAADSGPPSSTRALRKRNRAEDSTTALERSRAPGALEKAIAARSGESSRFSSPPRSHRAARSMDVDSDEDNDELDFMSSASFSDQVEQKQGHPVRPNPKSPYRPTSSGEMLGHDIQVEPTSVPPPKTELAGEAVVDEAPFERVEATEVQLASELSVKQSEPVRRMEEEAEEEEEESPTEPEGSKEKDEAMEVEEVEVETITKGREESGAPERRGSTSNAIDTKHENATVNPADIIIKPTPETPSREPSQSIQASPAPSSLPPSPRKVPILPLQVQSSASQDEQAFKMDTSTDLEARKGANGYVEADSLGHFNPHYVLPPLNILPADFTKKAKPIKRSKKEKERESRRDKDDAVPLGLAKWSATLMANPLWRKVGRATKTLSTREWSIAMTELRLVRTIERIELLKNDGRWSFRQPKKQRGVGGLTKSHWDYLLEEMKWMRVDFREERRWKLALAYNLSTAVLEWHFVKTQEEREKAGIVVKWRRPKATVVKEILGESSMDMSSDDLPAPDNTKTTAQLLGVDYGSEEEEEEEPENRPDVIDPLAPSAAVQDALDAASEVQPKHEEVEDAAALQLMQVADTLDDANQATPDSRTEVDTKKALKSNSDNPLLSGSKSSSQSVNGDSEPTPPMSKKAAKSALSPVRERIVHSDDLFLDIGAELQNLNIKSKSKDPDVQSILDLQVLFPDLHPFGILDVSPGPPMFTTDEKKKKSEKKSDRDDPTKRLEDTTYTKLYPIGRFMQSKPTLIGPLQPAKRFQDGKWLPIDPQPVAPELDAKIPDDLSNELFEGRSAGASSGSLQIHGSKARRAEQLWTQADDTLLKQIYDRYSSNWPLVAECYNSSRLTTTTERRTPIECMERWKERWSAEKRMQVAEPSSSAMPSSDDLASSSIVSSSSQSQMTTRGVKRIASASISSAQGIPIGGEKKRRRHYLLQDSIKRAAKKRTDAVQKMLVNQRKPSAVHETHNQYNKLPKLTPLELARMKADRDQRETHDFQLARRRQEEALRASLLAQRAAAQGQPGQPAANQAQAQQGQAPQAAAAQPVAQAAQPSQASAPAPQGQVAQASQAQQPTIPQLQPQQLAQLQQLQAQQASQAAARLNAQGIGMPNRPPTRMAAAPANVRAANPQAQAQAQLLQQARLQLPMHLQPGAQANLVQVLSQAGNAAALGAANPYYANLSNLTQEQLLAFMQSNQHAAQQQAQQAQQQPAAGAAAANVFPGSS